MDAQKKEKHIESPLVRYNKFDQPVCRLCDVVLQSEFLWDAHQVSRKHLETCHWLRAVIWEVIEGLVTTASMMISAGVFKQDMILLGLIWLVAQACGKLVSVLSKLDREVAVLKGGIESGHSREKEERDTNEEIASFLNRLQAAGASAIAFSVGAKVPLLAAFFISEHKVWLGVVMTAVSVVSMVLGWLLGVLTKAPVLRNSVMFLVGGWMVISTTYVLMKLIVSSRFFSSLDM